MKNFTAYIIPAAIVVCLGCKTALPVKDMSKARFGITQAQEVKADKYAPEELEKAKQYLYDTHSLVADEKMKDAQKKSVESHAQSQTAIEKSLPLYSSDMIASVKESIAEIEMLNAMEFASVEHAQAAAAFNEASQLHNNAQYRPSIQKSQEALGHTADAKVKSLAMLPQLRDQLVALEQEAESLSKDRGQEFAKEQLDTAKQKILESDKSLNEQHIAAATSSMLMARDALTQAKTAIERGKAGESLEAAKSLHMEISQRGTAQHFAEELTEAESLIAYSGELFHKENYSESYDASQQAVTVLNTMLIAMAKKEETLALQSQQIEQAAAPTKVEEPQKHAEYIVQYNPKARDCLWRIALNIWRNARLWPLIYIANKDQIKDPDLIFPGQRFVIPELEKDKPDDSKEEHKQ